MSSVAFGSIPADLVWLTIGIFKEHHSNLCSATSSQSSNHPKAAIKCQYLYQHRIKMKKKRLQRLFLFMCTITLSACTHVMYEGSERPDSEVATLRSVRTYILQIDGHDVSKLSGGNEARYKLAPGRHTIVVGLNDGDTGVMRRTSKESKEIVFDAKAGGVYKTIPAYPDQSNKWIALLIDGVTGVTITADSSAKLK